MNTTPLILLDSRSGAGANSGGYTLDCRADYLRHLRRRGLSPNSIEKYGIHLRAFEQWLGRPITDASTADIEVFLDTRHGRGGGRLTDRSRCEWISHLRCYYTWERRTHASTALNPTDAIIRPKLRRLMPRPISEADLVVAMTAADDDRTMFAMIILGAFAGFRCCEMAWLMGESVLWHEGVLNVFGKGRKERIVDMHPLVGDALRSVGVPRSGPVFRRPTGEAWTPRRVSMHINMFFTDHGINAVAHQLRHRFGTQLYAVCRNLRVVQEQMGHAYSSTTDVYTAFARDDARAAVMALPEPTNATDEAA